MPNLNLTTLEQIANVDFETFKAVAQTPGLNNIAAQYYTTLKSEAETAGLLHVENYAQMAKSVVNKDSINGVFANQFT